MDTPSVSEHEQPTEEPRRYGRRLFLVTLAGGISSLYWGKAAWDHVTGIVSPVASTLVPIIPTGGWRIYTISGHMPVFDPATWRLRIGGLVDKPVSLTYDELRALPRVEQVSNFHCVTGWSVDNVHWGGVRLGDVLAQAQPQAAGHALRFVSMEVPYVDYLTYPQASLADVMLAYEMDGRPLPQEHGAPVRLIIPEMYGYKNVKWLNGIDVVPRALNGYWEDLGYDSNAWVGGSAPKLSKRLPLAARERTA